MGQNGCFMEHHKHLVKEALPAVRDAGVKLERVSLAQQASENIIKPLVSNNSIRRFSNKPLSSFLSNVMQWGNGLYIVDLDFHVGFLFVENIEWLAN